MHTMRVKKTKNILIKKKLIWSEREDLNLRPPTPHAGALPDCATPRIIEKYNILKGKDFYQKFARENNF